MSCTDLCLFFSYKEKAHEAPFLLTETYYKEKPVGTIRRRLEHDYPSMNHLKLGLNEMGETSVLTKILLSKFRKTQDYISQTDFSMYAIGKMKKYKSEGFSLTTTLYNVAKPFYFNREM